jgi:hypothetical protein
MRLPAALAAASLSALTLLAVPSDAETSSSGWQSYRVHVLPDPTQHVSPYDSCGVIDAAVVGHEIGRTARSLRVRAGKTLTAYLTPELNVFAGDVGLNWSLRLYDASWHELARSSGPAWRTSIARRVPRTQAVWLVACNANGVPGATVSYALR